MTAPLVAVDIGNTVIKVGLFHTAPRAATAPDSVREMATADGSLAGLHAALPTTAVHWFVSRVHRAAEIRLAEWVRTERPADTYRVLTHKDILLRMDVEAPERVGFDRLATAVAANALRSPSSAAIVVDLGTALKVHLVTANGEFAGGAIGAGLRMSAKALRGETDLLPHVAVSFDEEAPQVLGKNTDAAIRSGLYWGVVGAARELVSHISAGLETPPQLYVTGGAAAALAPRLSPSARYVPHLCLSGVALIAAQE